MNEKHENAIIPVIKGAVVPKPEKLIGHDTTGSITTGIKAVRELEKDLGRVPTMDEASEVYVEGYHKAEKKHYQDEVEGKTKIVDGAIKED